MITVLATSTGPALTTVADVKEILSECDNRDDALLGKLINRASARIESYCGRTFGVQKYQEIIPGYGGTVLQLAKFPIRKVFRVFDGTDTDNATELSATGYRIDYALGQLNRDEGFPWTYQLSSAISFEPLPGQEYKNWLVEYSAGYVPVTGWTSTWEAGATATGSNMPDDLQDAAQMMVRGMYINRDRDPNIQSERVGELSISYAAPSGMGSRGISDDIADVLAPYRSVI